MCRPGRRAYGTVAGRSLRLELVHTAALAVQHRLGVEEARRRPVIGQHVGRLVAEAPGR